MNDDDKTKIAAEVRRQVQEYMATPEFEARAIARQEIRA